MATGTSTEPADRLSSGFTLLEILVVLLIVGIILGLLRLAVSPREQGVAEEGKRLAALLNLAREEAILNSTEMALELSPLSYRFARFDNDTWQPLSDDETFRERTLADGLGLRLTIEGQAIPLSPFPEIEGRTDPDQGPARIYLLSSGEVTPFELSLADPATGTECGLALTAADQIVVTDPSSPQ